MDTLINFYNGIKYIFENETLNDTEKLELLKIEINIMNEYINNM